MGFGYSLGRRFRFFVFSDVVVRIRRGNVYKEELERELFLFWFLGDMWVVVVVVI